MISKNVAMYYDDRPLTLSNMPRNDYTNTIIINCLRQPTGKRG